VAAEPPKLGGEAPDFALKTLQGEEVKLSALAAKGPVVVVVLRGYPGYQCPACTAQAGQFLGKAKAFAGHNTQIVLVYPGAAEKLAAHADDFIRGKTLPGNVHFVIDPDFAFVNAYSLRWDAANETAYPATFVVDGQRKIHYALVSTTHGGRAPAADVLAAVEKLK
jgi:peroxiredoxin